MWTRRELKEEAKAVLKKHYWKAVLVGILVMFVGDAMNMSMVTGHFVSISGVEWNAVQGEENSLDAFSTLLDSQENSVISIGTLVIPFAETLMWEQARMGNLIMITVICLLTLLVLWLMQCFLTNPFAVLHRGFFVNSFEKEIGIGEAFQITCKKYWNCIRVMFLRDLKIFLWSCLYVVLVVMALLSIEKKALFVLMMILLILGTILLYIKIYECMPVPYILADNPNIGAREALSESKRLMKGEKWNLFVLQLSFMGWTILSVLTVNILAIFFLTPYQCYTYAAWYRKLNPNRKNEEDDMVPVDYTQNFTIKVLDNWDLDEL